MKPGYTRILHSDDKNNFINTEIHFFQTRNQQMNLLKMKITTIRYCKIIIDKFPLHFNT